MTTNVVDLSEEIAMGIRTRKRLLKLVLKQLSHIEDDLYKFEDPTTGEYQQMSKADYFLHINEIVQVLPLLTEVLHSQVEGIGSEADKAEQLFEQLRAYEDTKKDQ